MKRDWRVSTGPLEVEVNAEGWLDALALALPELGFERGVLGRLQVEIDDLGGAVVRDPVIDVEILVVPLGEAPVEEEAPFASYPTMLPAEELPSFVTSAEDVPEPAFLRASRAAALPPPTRAPALVVAAGEEDNMAASAPAPVPVAPPPASVPTAAPSPLPAPPPPPAAPPPAPVRAVAPTPAPVPPAVPTPPAIAPPPAPVAAPEVPAAPPPRPPSPPEVRPSRPPLAAAMSIPPQVVSVDDELLEDLFLRLGEISSASGVAGASGIALRIVLDLVPAGAGAVLIKTHTGDGLRFRAASGPAAREIIDTVIPIDRGIAGYVCQLGVGLSVGDVTRDNRHYSRVDRSTGFRTRSILAVPVRSDNAAIYGVLELLNPPEAFTGEHFELATRVAVSLGTFLNSIDSAR